MSIIEFAPLAAAATGKKLYRAREFSACTEYGTFRASGTLCGHVDFVGPFSGCYAMSPDEVLALIVMLQMARADVLENSDPMGDPRIVGPR